MCFRVVLAKLNQFFVFFKEKNRVGFGSGMMEKCQVQTVQLDGSNLECGFFFGCSVAAVLK